MKRTFYSCLLFRTILIALLPIGILTTLAANDPTMPLWQNNTLTNSVSSLTYSPDGAYLVAAHGTGPIEVRRAADGALVTSLNHSTDYIDSMLFSKDQKYLAASGTMSSSSSGWGEPTGAVELWDTTNWSILSTNWFYHSFSLVAWPMGGQFASSQWLNSGSGLSGGNPFAPNRFDIWDVNAAGALSATVGYDLDGLGGMLISPDGAFLASGRVAWGGLEFRVFAIDTVDLNMKYQLPAAGSSCFSPDSRWLISHAKGGPALEVWQLSDGAFVKSVPITTNILSQLRMSNGDVILGASRRNGVYFWSLLEGCQLHFLEQTNLSTFALSPAGETIAVGCERGILRVLPNPFGEVQPFILHSMQSQEAGAGQTVTWQVSVAGLRPMEYEWFYNQSSLAKGTNPALVLTNAQPSQAGNYQLVARNAKGSATSDLAQLTVTLAPHIATQPVSAVADAGDNLILRVQAFGAPPLRYQWQFNGANLNRTNASLGLYNIQAEHAGDYRVMVRNDYGSATSQVAVLAVNPLPPIILTQPQGQSVPFGENVLLKTAAAGSQPLRYQWWINNSLMVWKGTNASLWVTNVNAAVAGDYTVVIRNAFGAVTSQVASITTRDPATLAAPNILWKRNGHLADVSSLTVSPDGQWSASADAAGRIKLWHMEDGKMKHDWDGHAAGEVFLQFQPDDTTLASVGSGDKTVKLWSLADGALIRSFTLPVMHPLRKVVFSSDGNLLATLATWYVDISEVVNGMIWPTRRYRSQVELWQASTGNRIRSYAATEGQSRALALSPDGEWLAFADADNGDSLIYPTSSHTLKYRLQGHTAEVVSVAFSPDSNVVTTGSRDKTLIFWQMSNGAMERKHSGYDAAVAVQTFIPNGWSLAAGAVDGKIDLWRVHDGARLWQLIAPRPLSGTAFTPDKNSLLTSGGNLEADWDAVINLAGSVAGEGLQVIHRDVFPVQVWRSHNGSRVRTLTGHSAAVNVLTFSPAQDYLATGSDDENITIWDSESGEPLRSFACGGGAVRALAFDPNGSLLAAGNQDRTIQLWQASGELAGLLAGNTLEVNAVAFSPSGQQVVSGGNDGTVRLFEVSSLSQIQMGTAHAAAVNSSLFTPDGLRIVSASSDRSLKLWNSTNLALLKTIGDAHDSEILTLALTSDGSLLASGASDGTIKIWQMPNFLSPFSLLGHSNRIYSLSFSPDGKVLMSAGRDHTIRFWQIADGKPQVVLNQETSDARCAAYAPLGGTIAIGRGDSTLLMARDPYSSAAPAIVQQPGNISAKAGATVRLTVAAQGPPPIRYQWRFNGSELSHGTNSTLILPNVQDPDAGSYSVVARNDYGSVTSATAKLTLLTEPPSVVNQPSSQTTGVGGTVVFSVVAKGSPPLHYQWRFNEAEIRGATNASYTLGNVQLSSAGAYSVVVSSRFRSAASEPAALIVLKDLPGITTQPKSADVLVGDDPILKATVSGPAPIYYQWYFNGAPIPGATLYSLALRNLTLANAGIYTLVASNIAGSVTSAPVVVGVKALLPTFTKQPQSQNVHFGDDVSLHVRASGSAPLRCRWQWNGTDLAGATNDDLYIFNIKPARQGYYQAIVSNPAGSVTSQVARVTVKVPRAFALHGVAGPLVSPGTNAIYCQFFNLESNVIHNLYWMPVLPEGWKILGANGDGGARFSLNQVRFDAGLTNSTINFMVYFRVPAGQSGPARIFSEVAYYLDDYVSEFTLQAAPDPLEYPATTREPSRFLSITRPAAGRFHVVLAGETGHAYQLETSTNLMDWQLFGTETMRTEGFWEIQESMPVGIQRLFIRAKEE